MQIPIFFPRAILLSLLFSATIVISGCASSRQPVPVGTIPQAKAPTNKEEQHGQQVLTALTKQYKLDYSHPRYQSLLDCVDKLTKAGDANAHPWHVYLLKDDAVKNAAATQGNHIFVWTGMLNATKSEDELAAVIGHEIAHVLARHTDPDPNDQMRQALIEMGALAAGVAVAAATENPTIGQNAGRMTQSLSREVGNAVARYPFSRERELEADHIGLFLMAKAGYDPHAAIEFWQRALNDPAFSSSLEFFSTHPPAGKRLEQLKALEPRIGNTSRIPLPSSSSKPRAPSPKKTSPKTTSSNLPFQPLDSGDSFDVSSRNNTQPSQEQRWRVSASKSILRTAPQRSSRALGEFRQGAILRGRKVDSSWIKITTPDRGYLELQTLRAMQ